jgi:hypothetical protein
LDVLLPAAADDPDSTRPMGAQLFLHMLTSQPASVSQVSWWRTKCLRTAVRASGWGAAGQRHVQVHICTYMSQPASVRQVSWWRTKCLRTAGGSRTETYSNTVTCHSRPL